VIHDSLFDTLSSSAESANVLTSKVISTRAGQHVKLDFREFLKTFNECWNFVVRCEIIGRKMVVGLRGTVVSQVWVKAQSWKCVGLTCLNSPSHSCTKSFLQSASLPSSLVRSLVRSFLSLLMNTTVAVYLRTRATPMRNSLYSKLPLRQPPSSKHSSQISVSPLRPSPHSQRRPHHPCPCRYPPATSRSAARGGRHYANEAALAFLQRAHQGHALAQQHRNTRTRTPRKSGRIQAGRCATLTDAACKQRAVGACV
jgi:hypothetical protein